MFKELFTSKKETLLFLTGLLIFTGLNIFSASTMELHFDESYYWLYSQYPAFGYFDHPPLIAWLIYVGQRIFNGEIGIRIIIILLSTSSMLLLWQMVKQYSVNALLFWALIYAVILLHPYSFIATPDAPLFFFSILFFYFYSRYLEKNNLLNTLLLAITIALMIYSKYHAFLVVGFVFLSNLKLVKRFSFWMIVFLAFCCLLPHIIWLFDNNFPPIRFQLLDAHKMTYHFSTTLNYIVSEIAATGPLLGWLFLYILFSSKPQNVWEKGLKFTGTGVFLFFLVSTIKGKFEAHWTLVAIAPLILLSYKYVVKNPKWQKWILIAGLFNFSLLFLTRILYVTPLRDDIALFKNLRGSRTESQIIKKTTGNYPVIFQDAWTDASLFAYYTNDKSIGNMNSALFRRNQYDLFHRDDSLNGKKVAVLTNDSLQFKNPEKIVTNKTVWYCKKYDHFKSYYKLSFDLNETSLTNNQFNAIVTIHNTYNDTLKTGNDYNLSSSFKIYSKGNRIWDMLGEFNTGNLVIPPHGDTLLTAKFTVTPEMLDTRDLYLTFQLGELKPIPVKYKIDLKK